MLEKMFFFLVSFIVFHVPCFAYTESGCDFGKPYLGIGVFTSAKEKLEWSLYPLGRLPLEELPAFKSSEVSSVSFSNVEYDNDTGVVYVVLNIEKDKDIVERRVFFINDNDRATLHVGDFDIEMSKHVCRTFS